MAAIIDPIDQINASDYIEIQDTLESLSSRLTNILSTQRIIGLEAKNLRKTITDQAKNYQNLVKANSDFWGGLLKTKTIENDLKKLQQDKLYIEIQYNKALDDGNMVLAHQLQLTQYNNLELEEQLNHTLEANQAIDRQVGLTASLLAGLKKLPIIGDVLDVDEAIKKMRLLAVEGASTPRIILTGLGTAFKPVLDQLTLATAALFILKAAMKADSQSTELAKSLGVSKEMAYELRQEFVQYSRTIDDAYVTTDKLIEANAQLSQQLGVAGMFSAKMADDFSRLTNLMGLSIEQAGKLARLSVVNGKSISSTTKDIIKGAFHSGVANKLSVDQREILKEVSQLSAGILVKFRENPIELGKAVVQAKALGLNLQEVDKIGDSLLDWESSIQNELKAELITGRQINLERARYAALTGDQVSLMKEVASQAGDLHDFQKMNIIAQNSLAGAFGLSREELSGMLIDQDKFNRLGDVSNKTAQEQLELARQRGISVEDSLYQSLQQQSAQEKFNQAIEKLSDLLGNLMAGPVGQLVDAFANLANNATVVKIAMGGLVAFSVGKLLMGLASMAVELGIMAAGAISTMSALTLGIGAVAIAAGIATAMIATQSAKSKATTKINDGVIDPDGGLLVSGPKGSIQLDKNDSIIAGTDLGGKGNNNNSDLTPLINAINEVKLAVNKLYTKEGNVYLDGKRVGTALNIGSYKLA